MKLPSQKLLDRISFEPMSGCWLWTSYLDRDGYGSMCTSSGPKPAHRIVYEEMLGKIPAGMVIDHKCNLRSCVNPEHLQVVSNEENIYLGVVRDGRMRRIEKIRGLLRDGMGAYRIAEMLGVCPKTVYNIRNGVTKAGRVA